MFDTMFVDQTLFIAYRFGPKHHESPFWDVEKKSVSHQSHTFSLGMAAIYSNSAHSNYGFQS
jgi:hypothetical protein